MSAFSQTGGYRRLRFAIVLAAAVVLGFTFARTPAGALAPAKSGVPARPAVASAPRGFFGVQPWHFEQADMPAIASADIRTYRVPISWASIEATKGVYDWSEYDAMFRVAAQHGVTILPVLITSPPWLSSNHLRAPTTAAHRAKFAVFTAKVAERYGRGGEFWRLNPDVPVWPLLAYQVWNEPNLKPYWNRRPNARRYVQLVKSVSIAVKRVDPAAKIVLAGVPESRLGIPMLKYLTQIYRVPRAKSYFDFVALHPYAADTRGIKAALLAVRKIQRSNRDLAAPVWFTEVGWATPGRRRSPFFTKSVRKQKALLTQTMTMLTKMARRHRVAGAIWFALRDRKLEKFEADWWGVHTGLFTTAGKPKPAWSAYRKIVRRFERPFDPYRPTG